MLGQRVCLRTVVHAVSSLSIVALTTVSGVPYRRSRHHSPRLLHALRPCVPAAAL
jgi:hypothetical protein